MSTLPLVCVVDDDEGMRESLDGLVRSLGYRVAAYPSAEALLASAEALESVCVISDIQMPGMDGLTLTRRLAKIRRDLPVILISAFLNEEIDAEAKAAGAHCFLRKPFDDERLIDCIDHALCA